MKTKDEKVLLYKIAEVNKFSIHTLQFCIIVRRDEFNLLNSLLKQKSRKIYENPQNRKEYAESIFYLKGVAGIRDIRLCRLCDERILLFLSIIVNARALLNITWNKYVSIAPAELLDKIMPRLKEELQMLEIPLRISKRIYVSRVDYCTNIDLKTQEAVLLYIKLLHKGKQPFRLEEVKRFDKKQKRWISSKYEYTVRNSRYEFSIYSKQKQMEECMLGSEEERALAEGQIRIEYRVSRDKIRDEMKKYEFEDEETLLVNASMVAQEEMSKILYYMYGTGDFVKCQELKKRVEESSYHEETKKAMLEFSHLANGRYGIGWAYKCFGTVDGYGMLKRFNEIGISPICIPHRNEIDTLHSPLYYIAYSNVNER